MLKRTERRIYCYDLRVTTRAAHATPPPLADIVAAWETMYRNGDCAHERDKGRVVYRIGDIAVDSSSQIVSVLLRRGDPEASNAVYSHRHTGSVRVAARQPDENGDRAAHIVISLKQESKRPGSYLMHLEGISGISHQIVQSVLNAVLKKAIKSNSATFEYDDAAGARNKTGAVRRHTFTPTIELLGHPCKDLEGDIANGRVSEIVLVDQRPKAQLGGNKYLYEVEKSVKVKADPNLPRLDRVKEIIRAAKAKSSDYQQVRVRFKDTSGVSRMAEYDIATGNPDQQRYVRSYIIDGINPPMDESSPCLVQFLSGKMVEKVEKERT